MIAKVEQLAAREERAEAVKQAREARVAQQVAANVVAEAIDEVTGESSRRWALKIIVVMAVAGIAWWLYHRRQDETATGDESAAA